MKSPTSQNAVLEQMAQKHHRFPLEAYEFVRESLDFTVKKARTEPSKTPHHVSGQELLEGFREHALEQFGPLSRTVLGYWNFNSCEDVGEAVFHMVKEGILGSKPTDSINDFKGGYDFDEAFSRPFIPSQALQTGSSLPA